MLPHDLTTIITLATGGVYLLLAVLALVRQGTQPKAARALALFALVSALWMLSQIPWRVGWFSFLREDFLARLPWYGLLLLSIFFLSLVRAFLRLEGSGWGWWLLGVLWIAAVLGLDANPLAFPEVLFSGPGWIVPRREFVLSAIPVGWGIFMGASTLLTLFTYHKTRRPFRRNRIKFLSPALVFFVLGDTLVFLTYWPLGSAICLAGTLIIAYAVLVYHLPAFRQGVLRLASYLITTGLAVGLYVLVIMALRTAFQSTTSLDLWAVEVGLAVLLAILYTPFLNWLQKLVHRLIAGVTRDPTYILRKYSQSISNILDVQVLASEIMGLLREAMGIRHGFLFLVDHERGQDGKSYFHLRGMKGMEAESPDLGLILEQGPVGEYLFHEHHPLTQYDLDMLPRFAETSPEERSWFSSLSVEVYVPIFAKDEWIGLLALGPKDSGVPYVEEDLELLSTLANQTAVALENARLVEGLLRLNGEFRRAYTALDQANRHLERLDRTKSDFISIASHELRTPLTILSGYSQMLSEDPKIIDDPGYAKMVKGILGGAQRLHEIVDSMIDMAKIDSKDLQLDHQPVSIQGTVMSVREGLSKAIAERKQELELKDLGNLPAVEADPEALRKVFYHLMINAIKYTPDGGKITVSGRSLLPSPVDYPQGGVEIVISDTGIGIDPRLYELIFVKFYQTGELALHSTGKTKFKGAGPGLGLAITKGIVEAHGGKVWVESPGHDEVRCPGSQFHVVLPLRRSAVTRPANPRLDV